jgi:hypothetical protein
MSFIKPIAAVAALSIAALTVAAPAEARDRHRHHHHGHHHHGHHGHGDAVAAGVFGLAAGALLAGALAQPQPRAAYASDWVAYCSAKYRTYNPATNLYVGYDGYYHECR